MVGDESMSEIRFQTTEKGKLPHLSYSFRKTDPLGEEFKTDTYSVTGSFILIEIWIVKEGMKHRNYQQHIGVIASCTKRVMEATKMG